MVRSGNLFADLPARSDAELTTILAEGPGVAIERIVSTGQASAAGFWYDQDSTEWVILLQGAARLLIEGEASPRICARETMSRFPRTSATGSNGRLRTSRPFGWPFT